MAGSPSPCLPSNMTVEANFAAEKEEELPFKDIPADFWTVEEIAWAYGKGDMNGVIADQFAPGRTVTRQQLWMVLARLAGEKPADMAAARRWPWRTACLTAALPAAR